MSGPKLQYEPTAAARPVVVESAGDGVTRIVVAMPGPYVPLPRWVGDLELLTFVVEPIWWIGTYIARTFLRLPKPPRAVFEISADVFKITLRDPGSGELTVFDCPRGAVAEARANRSDKGLWLNLPGHVKETYLADLPRESIERIEEALRDALARPNGG